MTDSDRRLRDAAAQGDTAAVTALIAAGADPNARNMADNTALHFAARAGCADVVRVLIGAGADRGAKNVYGATALDIAVRDRRGAAAAALREP